MDIIVVGCGRVGSRFASILNDEGHNVVIIDQDKVKFEQLKDTFNGVLVVGYPIDQDVLKEAGIESADALIAATPDDNINIMASQIAKEQYKVPNVITRIHDPEKEKVFSDFGLKTICPTEIAIDIMKTKLLGDVGTSKHNVCNNMIEMTYEKVTKNTDGKKLSTIKTKEQNLLLGVLRSGILNLFQPDFKLKKEDVLVWVKRSNI